MNRHTVAYVGVAILAAGVLTVSLTLSQGRTSMDARADDGSEDSCRKECAQAYQDCVELTTNLLVKSYTGGCHGDKDACVPIAQRQCAKPDASAQLCLQGCQSRN
jgi:hypothetical protein